MARDHVVRSVAGRGLTDMDQLQTFLTVIEHGSVLGAANALALPRSTVRAKLDALELEFGVALLTRTRDGAEATAAGLALAERARSLVNQLRALPSSVREEMLVPTGELRLRLPIGLPPEMMGLLVGLFRDRYPQVPLHLSFAEDPSVQLPPDVDVLMHFGPTVPRGPFMTQTLLSVEQHLLASPEYLAEHGVPQTLADLAEHELFVWVAPGEDGRSLPLRSGGVVPVAPSVVSSDIHLLRTMVAAGAGLGLLPNPTLTYTPSIDGLVPVMYESVSRMCAVRLATPAVRASLPRTRAVIALIREAVAGVVGFLPPDDL